jgi:hypothetical protein
VEPMESHIWGTRAHDHIAGAVMELVDDSSRIADLLRAASCAGRSLRVQAGCDAIVATPAAIGNGSVVWRAAPHRDALPETLGGILDGYISCYELTLTDVRPSPEGFVSAVPASLRRTRRRCEPRALYEESGYLRLSGKQPGEFGPLAEAVDHARARLGDVADVGCQVV